MANKQANPQAPALEAFKALQRLTAHPQYRTYLGVMQGGNQQLDQPRSNEEIHGVEECMELSRQVHSIAERSGAATNAGAFEATHRLIPV